MKNVAYLVAVAGLFFSNAGFAVDDPTWYLIHRETPRNQLAAVNPYWRLGYQAGSVWYVPTDVFTSHGATIYYHYRPATASRPLPYADISRRVALRTPVSTFYNTGAPLALRRDYPMLYPNSVRDSYEATDAPRIAQHEETEKDLPPIGEGPQNFSPKASAPPENSAAPGIEGVAVIEQLKAAASKQPTAPNFYALGNALKARGDFARAIDYFSRTIVLDRTDANAYYKRALSYTAIGRPELALPDFQEANRLTAGKPCAWRQDAGAWICQSGY